MGSSTCWTGDHFTNQQDLHPLTNRNPPRIGSTAEIEHACRSWSVAKS